MPKRPLGEPHRRSALGAALVPPVIPGTDLHSLVETFLISRVTDSSERIEWPLATLPVIERLGAPPDQFPGTVVERPLASSFPICCLKSTAERDVPDRSLPVT